MDTNVFTGDQQVHSDLQVRSRSRSLAADALSRAEPDSNVEFVEQSYELSEIHSHSSSPTRIEPFAPEDNASRYYSVDLPRSRASSHSSHFQKGESKVESKEYFHVLTRNWNLIFACFGVSFTGFFFGYDTGTVGGITNMQPWLKRFGHYNASSGEYEMSTAIIGIIVSAFHIGCITGGFTIARLADHLGRRAPIAIACFVYMIGISVQLSAGKGKWYQYMIGRMITGLTVGANAVLSPMLLSEIAPPTIRGVIVNFYQINVTHGILVGYIVDYATKGIYTDNRMWRLPLIGGYIFSLIIIPVLTRVPESPRYLIQRGRFEDAKKCVAKLKGFSLDFNSGSTLSATDAAYMNEVVEEVEFLKAASHYQLREQRNASFWQLFSKKYLKRTISGMCVMAFQQMSGIDYFLYYGTKLFKSVGIEDSYVTSIILGAINAGMTYVSIFVADNLGRKKGLFWGSVSCFTCLFIFSTIGVVMVDHQENPNAKLSGTIMIVFTCLFIAVFCCSWSAIASVLVSEIFSLEIKSKAMAFSQAFNWGSNFFIALCTPIITARIGYAFGYVFTGFMFVAIIFVYFFIPETKGMTLEEIDDYYEGKHEITEV